MGGGVPDPGEGTACADVCGTPLWAVIAASGGLERRLASRGEGGRPPRVAVRGSGRPQPRSRWAEMGPLGRDGAAGAQGVFSPRSSRGRESLGGPPCVAPQNSGHVFFGFRGSCTSCWTMALLRALYAAASVLGVQPRPRRGTPMSSVLGEGGLCGFTLFPTNTHTLQYPLCPLDGAASAPVWLPGDQEGQTLSSVMHGGPSPRGLGAPHHWVLEHAV